MSLNTQFTLRTAVVLPFLLIFLTTFTVLTVVQNNNYEKMASDVSRKQLSALSENVELELSAFLFQPMQASLALSHSIELHHLYKPYDVSAIQNTMLSKFRDLYSHVPQLDNIGFGGQNGEYVGLRKETYDEYSLMLQDHLHQRGLVIYQGHEISNNIRSVIKDYDPRFRPWYKPYAGINDSRWSPIYANADERQEVTLSATEPVYYGNTLQGVVVSDVKLSTFNTFLGQQQKDTGAVIFLFDESRRLIAHSTGGSIISWGTTHSLKGQRLLASESSHPVIQSSASYSDSYALSQAHRLFTTYVEGERYFHLVTPYKNAEGLNWFIGVSISEHELLGSMLDHQHESWLIGFIVSSVGIILGLIAFNRTVTPITSTANAAKQLAQGNWDSELPKPGNVYETSMLVHAFNEMADNLKASFYEISNQLLYDSLTKLYSREGLVNTCSKLEQLDGSLILIGINKFRHINDSIGHLCGDQLLVIVAERMKSTFEDDALIARIGGDEFAIYLPNVQSSEEISFAIARIQQMFAAPFCLMQESIVLQVSLGVVKDHQQETMTTWLRNGSIALSNAKQEQASVSYYKPEMADKSRNKTRMLAKIKQAIELQEFVPYYQPIVDIQSGKVIGAEALARWLSPTEGLISPLEFIPLAEESGFISSIGEMVLSKACHDAVLGMQQGKWEQDFHLHVNLSVNQLSQAKLVEQLTKVLTESKLPAHNLTLEITESRLVDNDPVTIQNMQAIRDLGIQIAIDDFGTGYSSLAYLHKLPFDCLKIDRTFVNKLDHDHLDTSIVAAIINMTRGMKVDIVAEGIETHEQAEMLKQLECSQGQGFLYSRPVPFEQWPTNLVNMKS
ncbi:phosphodiesterase GepA [Vibrio panuliri]|uniref:Diguanylate cyclase n=1 Tax=Vibrio panuliri TaxID=1381081 RepID=A0ABX3FVQ9_9VIBR|nr:EAL domain-containing protein [Vibrio panuliri]KAB1458972.1 EAL domain-containing protein [Vibrio panuliri]OLQ96543.1 diguanylate cyclase [Vibrio panuliri]